MPVAAKGRCSELGCTARVTTKGRCQAHQRVWQVRSAAYAARDPDRGLTDRLRRQVREEEPTCRVHGCWRATEEVDHVVALSLGGARHDRDNLQGLCTPHHREKSGRDRAALNALRRAARA